MARFFLLLAAAGLVLLVAMAEATTKTVFTTTTTLEENPTGRRTVRSCSQQMMLNKCSQYFDMISHGMSQGTQQKYLQMCCMQLQSLDEMCRCDNIKTMMKGLTQQQMGMALNLPNMCNLQPGMCQMQAVWF